VRCAVIRRRSLRVERCAGGTRNLYYTWQPRGGDRRVAETWHRIGTVVWRMKFFEQSSSIGAAIGGSEGSGLGQQDV